MAGILLAVLSYAAFTSGVAGPGNGDVRPDPVHAPQATLTFAGADPIITGSVGHLFEALGTFVGPNEAMKADRLRPGVDVLSLTRSFDAERMRIAALQNSNNAGALPVAATTQVADSTVPVSPTAVSAKIALAAVDPSAVAMAAPATDALNAIDSAAVASPSAVDPGLPIPATLSKQLAYAREDAPLTTFPDYQVSDKYAAKDLNCLAQAVYFEARGESYRGQVAVAQVVMNRLAHPLYPKTICNVVFQDAGHRDACQFSFACDGIPEVINEPGPWKQAQEIAQKVAAGELYLPEVANATHYHATYVYPDWAPRLKRVTKIGMHIFYKFRNA
ncbi:MAG: cell wall hydrolase [Devosia sp.]|nr:cell wall hydrolase [Devosia sp.]